MKIFKRKFNLSLVPFVYFSESFLVSSSLSFSLPILMVRWGKPTVLWSGFFILLPTSRTASKSPKLNVLPNDTGREANKCCWSIWLLECWLSYMVSPSSLSQIMAANLRGRAKRWYFGNITNQLIENLKTCACATLRGMYSELLRTSHLESKFKLFSN